MTGRSGKKKAPRANVAQKSANPGDLAIEYRPIAGLIPYARNARTHSDEQVAQIAASIREFGFTNPILLDGESGVIAGHGRLLAARKLGLESVPCIELAGMSDTQRRAYIIADNKLALNAGWDTELLSLEFADLQALGVDLSVLGFGEDEIVQIMQPEGTAGLTDPDEVPEAPKEPVTVPGDLWILGRHRLMCGDSTIETSVGRLMLSQRADLFSTDPPYLVDYTGADRPNNSGKDWSADYREVDIPDADKFFHDIFSTALLFVKEGAAWYCWHAHKRASQIEKAWEECGVLNHQQIVWVKPVAMHGYSFWPWQHEPCLMGWIKGKKPRHDGDNSHKTTSVWMVDWEGKTRVTGNEHPTQKPVELFAIPMRKHTKAGDVCFEPFSGSGSQLMAGEKEGRIVYAMELSPKFVDVAVTRWQNFTGKNAILENDGRTFSEIQAQRSGMVPVLPTENIHSVQ